jgi:hypothetical protein
LAANSVCRLVSFSDSMDWTGLDPLLTVTNGSNRLRKQRATLDYAAQSGNLSARSIAWKRGSLRNGSKKKFTFV